MSAQDALVAALKIALQEAAEPSAWIDLPDVGVEAVLDGRFDLSLLAASLHASGYRPPARVIDDPADVPVQAVIWWPADKTIAARFDEVHGVVFGDDRPFAWSVIKGPVTVLWESGDPR
jgi:hypothetical protein